MNDSSLPGVVLKNAASCLTMHAGEGECSSGPGDKLPEVRRNAADSDLLLLSSGPRHALIWPPSRASGRVVLSGATRTWD
jgi:hypothetical protein